METIGSESMIMGGCNCRDCISWKGYRVTGRGEYIPHSLAKTKDGRKRKYCQDTEVLTVENFGCENYKPTK